MRLNKENKLIMFIESRVRQEKNNPGKTDKTHKTSLFKFGSTFRDSEIIYFPDSAYFYWFILYLFYFYLFISALDLNGIVVNENQEIIPRRLEFLL